MSQWQPKIVVFLCQYALKSDAIWARRLDLPPNVRVLEVPCSGRINPLLLLSALQHGADGLLVIGCEQGHCHYKEGNYLGRRKFATLRSFLQHLGLGEERVRFVWLTKTESGRFPQLVENWQSNVQRLGPLRELAVRETAPCAIPVRSTVE